MVPVFRGVGFGMMVVRFLVNCYYSVICAWAFFYLFAGFTSKLPWDVCDANWNTYDCYTVDFAQQCNENQTLSGPYTFYNGTCTLKEDYCYSHGYVAYE